MRNNRLGSILKLAGGILLAVFLFFMLSLSDVVRLNPLLEGVSNASLSQAARNGTVYEDYDILLPASELSEGAETDFSGTGDGALAQSLPTLTFDDERYYLCTFDEFQAIGGKLSTDKFGDPKLVEYEGTSYAQGVVKIGQNMWDNLDGWSRFLVIIAPAITPVLIIAAVALIGRVAAGYR